MALSTSSSYDTTVSLEDHLRGSLQPLIPILPTELKDSLVAELDCTEIHYSLLLRISQWARSEDGSATLHSQGLSTNSYLMITLLAGTRTAPSSKPPPYRSPLSPEDYHSSREFNDRKALTAVLNGLLSVVCSGGAAWWAADKSGWRDEWKVLLALSVATVVGVSETVLYIIWQSRRSHTYKIRTRMATRIEAIHKKTDEGYSPILVNDNEPDAKDGNLKEVLDNTITGQVRRRAGRQIED